MKVGRVNIRIKQMSKGIAEIDFRKNGKSFFCMDFKFDEVIAKQYVSKLEENLTAPKGLCSAIFLNHPDGRDKVTVEIATRPACLSVSEEIDEPDPEKNCGFTISLMNQFNKEEPRFIEASFEHPNYHKGVIEEGWAVKAVLRFIGLHGITNNVYEYGENRTVCPEEKGLLGHDDDDLDFGEEED